MDHLWIVIILSFVWITDLISDGLRVNTFSANVQFVQLSNICADKANKLYLILSKGDLWLNLWPHVTLIDIQDHQLWIMTLQYKTSHLSPWQDSFMVSLSQSYPSCEFLSSIGWQNHDSLPCFGVWAHGWVNSWLCAFLCCVCMSTALWFASAVFVLHSQSLVSSPPLC